MGRKMGSSRREAHRLEKGLTWQSRLSRRISIHIGVWEHRIGKGMASTLDIEETRIPQLKTKQRIWLAKISRNKHKIEISFVVFVVGPTRARSYNTILYKALHWHSKCPRTSIAKGSLRHNETTVKTTVERRTTRRRTPISYHAFVEKIF